MKQPGNNLARVRGASSCFRKCIENKKLRAFRPIQITCPSPPQASLHGLLQLICAPLNYYASL